LCEGKEDRLVIEALAKHAGLAGRLAISHCDGESLLRSSLSNLKVRSDFRRGEINRVLVTRDADTDFNGAWAAVRDSVRSAFAAELAAPGEWVDTTDRVPIAGWIIPGPGQQGMIETLCLDASRGSAAKVFECLDPLMRCLEGIHGERPPEKVRFAVWTIIAQGTGVKKRLSLERALEHLPLDWDAEAFVSLKEILIGLVRSAAGRTPPR
jgi:hypothetical protein